jgi:hypothetical protein
MVWNKTTNEVNCRSGASEPCGKVFNSAKQEGAVQANAISDPGLAELL